MQACPQCSNPTIFKLNPYISKMCQIFKCWLSTSCICLTYDSAFLLPPSYIYICMFYSLYWACWKVTVGFKMVTILLNTFFFFWADWLLNFTQWYGASRIYIHTLYDEVHIINISLNIIFSFSSFLTYVALLFHIKYKKPFMCWIHFFWSLPSHQEQVVTPATT